ncbi:hypothetical protein SRHO_G00289380 [Serrasalmus rhombeus]
MFSVFSVYSSLWFGLCWFQIMGFSCLPACTLPVPMTISTGSPIEAHHMWPAYTSSLQMALIQYQRKRTIMRSHTSDQDHLQSRHTADISKANRALQKEKPWRPSIFTSMFSCFGK